MAGTNVCNTCNRTVLLHSYQMKCHNCCYVFHLNCLPRVNRCDSIYIEQDKNCWFCPRCIEQILPYNHIFDDDEYLKALSENWNLPLSIPIDLLNHHDKIFLPFDLNEKESNPLADCDPDIQYYNNQFNSVLYSCDYFFEDSCNEKLKRDNIDSNSFSLLHANIRSSAKNLKNFETYLTNIDHKFKVLGISESWLKTIILIYTI